MLSTVAVFLLAPKVDDFPLMLPTLSLQRLAPRVRRPVLEEVAGALTMNNNTRRCKRLCGEHRLDGYRALFDCCHLRVDVAFVNGPAYYVSTWEESRAVPTPASNPCFEPLLSLSPPSSPSPSWNGSPSDSAT